jgi:hypothetical protein
MRFEGGSVEGTGGSLAVSRKHCRPFMAKGWQRSVLGEIIPGQHKKAA